jgi:multiple sugar transport system ATP-binding protein
MIYVTHDQVEAMTLATRIVVMQGGKIQQIGTPEHVYERPMNLFVAGFLGTPAMNFISGELDAQKRFVSSSLHMNLSAYSFINPWETSAEVTLGLRPEQIQIREDGQFVGTIALIEPMGSHQVVWLQVGAQTISSIVNDQRPFAIGQTVLYGIDVSKVSLFDPHSQQRL